METVTLEFLGFGDHVLLLITPVPILSALNVVHTCLNGFEFILSALGLLKPRVSDPRACRQVT